MPLSTRRSAARRYRPRAPARALGVAWGAKAERHLTSAANWKQPLRWNARHDEFFGIHGRRRLVFCASLADVLDNAWSPVWRRDDQADAQRGLVAADEAHRQRQGMIDEALPHDGAASFARPWPNVWLGAKLLASRADPRALAVR